MDVSDIEKGLCIWNPWTIRSSCRFVELAMMAVAYTAAVMPTAIINSETASLNVTSKLSVRSRICSFAKCSYSSLGSCESFLGGTRMADSSWNLFSSGKQSSRKMLLSPRAISDYPVGGDASLYSVDASRVSSLSGEHFRTMLCRQVCALQNSLVLPVAHWFITFNSWLTGSGWGSCSLFLLLGFQMLQDEFGILSSLLPLLTEPPTFILNTVCACMHDSQRCSSVCT